MGRSLEPCPSQSRLQQKNIYIFIYLCIFMYNNLRGGWVSDDNSLSLIH